MRKNYLPAIIVFIVILFALVGTVSGATILQTVQGGTGTSSPQGILYGSGSSNPLQTVSIGSNLTFSAGQLSAIDTSFSTTSASYFSSLGLSFSTTSNNYWSSVGLGFSTTSAAAYLNSTTSTGFSTTSANYYVHSSTTIPKTYTTNTFSLAQTFTVAPVFSSLTGVLKGNGASAVTVGVDGTDFTLIDVSSCALGLGHVSVTAAGVFTCGNTFSTTSAAYFSSVGLAFSTTSSTYHASVGLSFSTTSSSYFLSQNTGNAFSTTSASYFLSQNQGSSFSTTSASYFAARGLAFSTTSDAYFASVGLAHSTTSTAYQLSQSVTLGLTTFTGGFVSQASSSFTTLSGVTASTTNLTISGLPNCNTTQALTTSAQGVAQCGTITASGGGQFSFTPSLTGFFNQLANSTSTQLHLGGSPVSLSASSTSFFDSVVTRYATTTFASTTVETVSGTIYAGTASTSNLTVSNVQSAALITSSTGVVSGAAATTCTNQFVRSLTAAMVGTCATVGAADVSLANLTATDSTLTFSGTYNGSTARTIGINLSNANTWTGLQTFNTGGIISNASSTFLGGYFPALNRFGFASTSCSALWGGCIGTSTVMYGGFAIPISSSTVSTANVIPDWSSRNTVTVMLQQTSTVDLSGTSTHATDGQYVTLQACQDGTASRALTFIGVNTPVWGLPEGTTTVRQAAYNMTRIGIQYQNRAGTLYPVVLATSSISDTRLCR